MADRVWRAWWQDQGVSLDALRLRLEESLGTQPVPTALVAHRDAQFLGTVSLIATDVEQRPALSPWVAALWVEPPHRRAGIGAALVETASRLGFRLGHRRIHLAALPANAGYYRRRGWTTLEADVGGLDILSRAAPPD
ncbi:GNAT family N-acetyltransferase [Ancylobacter sp. 3268]|uniref:GNAT family N-acetyltransferase n=1 Tax=Ancylobacter sp. 3268 TaxID=2817752 RepID=UPI0038573D89